MLILTRKPKEGEDAVVLRVPPSQGEQVILVTLQAYSGCAVKVGVTAEPEVLIMREEAETPEIVEEWRRKVRGMREPE